MMCAVFTAVFGLILGSFFNVVIYRLPRQLSLAFPNSFCPNCKRPIRPIENIPVLSYLFLGGKCAGCKTKISMQYPLIETATGMLAVLLWFVVIAPFLQGVHQWWEYIGLTLQVASILVLVPVTMIDYYDYIIPDSITLPGIILGVGAALLPGGISPLESFLGLLAGGGSLLAIGLIGEFVLRKKEAMGGGDIKLMAFLGSIWGWKIALMGIVFGSVLGSIVGGGLILVKVLSRERPIPFGPFLAAGTLLALLYGDALVGWYLGLIESMVR
jgi:leader peptidase (prepilin peptidase)/N-methyltransferase